MPPDPEPSFTPFENAGADRDREQRGRWGARLVFTIYVIVLVGLHPACMRPLYGLRHEPAYYRDVYCLVAAAITVRGLFSRQRMVIIVAGVAFLMLVLAILCPNIVS